MAPPAPHGRSSALRLGWMMGLEPTTPGTTIRCSNRLSYIHHAGKEGLYQTDARPV